MTGTRTELRMLQAARPQAFAPSLRVLAANAVNAARRTRAYGLSEDDFAKAQDAELTARKAFIDQLWIQTGIGADLARDLVQECVI